jgi:hypothetical protein
MHVRGGGVGGILRKGREVALLQDLTLISGTQTGCHRLDSYI